MKQLLVAVSLTAILAAAPVMAQTAPASGSQTTATTTAKPAKTKMVHKAQSGSSTKSAATKTRTPKADPNAATNQDTANLNHQVLTSVTSQ